MIAKFRTTLAQQLRQGDTSVTSIKVQNITTEEGDIISMNDFPFGNVGYLVIAPEGPNTEIVKFTGIDAANNAFTGITRGLPFHLKPGQEETTVPSNVKEHSIGAEVIISDNPQWFYRIKKYIDDSLTGSVGNASETTAGIVFTDKPVLMNKPRVKAVEVHEQPTPNMTVRVEPFFVVEDNLIINFGGGNSPTFTAPTNNPRIDLLVYDTNTGLLAIRQGTESASPQLPTPQIGDYVLASIYLRPGSTRITDKDINTDAYIYRHTREGLYWYQYVPKFGGDGSDGDFVITSGTTTINLQGAKIFVKNYRNLEISGTGQLTFTNPSDNGVIIWFKVKNDCKITPSSTAIVLDNLGSLGGNIDAPSLPPVSLLYPLGYSLTDGTTFLPTRFAAASGGTSYGNPPSGEAFFLMSTFRSYYNLPPNFLICAGMGGGGGQTAPSSSANGGPGGRGAGALIIEVGGRLTFTSTISAKGSNGTQGTSVGGYFGGGGGGGSGGGVFIIYNQLIANTGVINVNGGNGGDATFYGGSYFSLGRGGQGGHYISAKGGNEQQVGGNSITGGTGGGVSAGGFNGGGGGAAGEKLILKNRWFH